MSDRRSLSFVMTAAGSLLCASCASGLDVSLVQAAQRRPSNLAVFFKVQTRNGQPIAPLDARQFRIYEDGSLVSLYESRQTILNPEIAAESYTLLLVDMSGSVSESSQVPLLVEAATHFTEAVGQYQRVAVYAFDGAPEIHAISPFTSSTGASSRGLSALAHFHPRDPSTNLNGAVVRALEVLSQAVSRARTPLRFGTLVVFTDGTDRAGRVAFSEVEKALDGQEHAVFAIGVGTEIDEHTLSGIGRSGHWLVRDSSAIDKAFQTAADRIVGYTRSHYLLSYCSPARAGKHQVTVEAIAPDSAKRGRLTYEFDAAGFGPGCEPGTAPPFDMKVQAARAARPASHSGPTTRGRPEPAERRAEPGAQRKPGQAAGNTLPVPGTGKPATTATKVMPDPEQGDH
jgi:von Willebrand factor type A domain